MPESSPLVLAVDVGTSKVRATAVDLTGASRAAAAAPLASGSSVVQTSISVKDLWRVVARCTREVVNESGRDHPIWAVGVTCQLGLVLLDADREPLGDALLWSDSRARLEAAYLNGHLSAETLAGLGRTLTGELPAAKLLWYRNHDGSTFARIRWVVSVKDYLVYRLTGALVTDETHASYTGMFDVRKRRWSGGVVQAAGAQLEWLPSPRSATTLAGRVSSAAAGHTGLAEGTPVAVGAPDGSTGVVGAGGIQPGVIVDVAGSTDVLLKVVAEPVDMPSSQAITNAHAVEGLWSVGGPTGLTGGGVEWLSRTLGYGTARKALEELEDEMRYLPPGSEGLLVRTTLTGARFPWADSGGGGFIDGVRARHRPAHLLRAAEEGAAFEVRAGLERLLGAGVDEGALILVGGSAASDSFAQLRADVCKRPVVVPQVTEASSLGAAMIAATAAGLCSSLEDAQARGLEVRRTFVPQADRSAAYDSVYEAWLERVADRATDAP